MTCMVKLIFGSYGQKVNTPPLPIPYYFGNFQNSKLRNSFVSKKNSTKQYKLVQYHNESK